MSEAEKWAWWREMSAKDPYFYFKMPIEFYGRVIDERGDPIGGATVRFSWINLSAEGTGQATVISDANGAFALTGAIGRSLTVQVEKEGYRTYVTRNRFAFYYAMFADPRFHEPDPSSPVEYVMRKNRETEPLVFRKKQEAELAPGQAKAFEIGNNGGPALVVERLPDMSAGPRGWAAKLSVSSGGGIALVRGEFPFEAPAEGYLPSIEISEKTPRDPTWSNDNGAEIFVQTPQGYGRVIVRNTPGMAWVYVTSYFNPKPGSRNLEIGTDNLIRP